MSGHDGHGHGGHGHGGHGHGGHGHGGHGHGGHDCGHDHDSGASGASADGDEWQLYREIDEAGMTALNATAPQESLRATVLRPWGTRMQVVEPVLQSNADEQLLIYLPFHAAIKLKALSVVGVGEDSDPSHMKVFVNVESMDFAGAESAKPTQKWDLSPQNPNGELEYATRYTRFQNVRSMWIFFSANFGNDVTRVQYIGLKGVATKHRREAVATSYELRPQLADHRTGNEIVRPNVL